jgi:hypothetical protein
MDSIEYAYTFDYQHTKSNVTRGERNRFWFNYPLEWTTANIKDKYVGFRSFYLYKATRVINFTITLYDDKKGSKVSIIVFIILNENDDMMSLIEKIKGCMGEYAQYFYFFSLVSHRRLNDYVYNGKNYVAWNSGKEPVASSDVYYSFGLTLFRRLSGPYSYFTMTDLSGETKALFNAEDFSDNQPEPYQSLFFYDVWSLNSCLLKSNLVNSTMNNHLGYSDKDYQPIKWYKVTNNDEKFYIDLYSGHGPEVRTILPYDNLDHITVELIFKFN